MAKQFSSIVELTRTFVRTDVWLAGRDWERLVQYRQLDKGLGAWQDPKPPRIRKYNAYLWPYSTALGPKIHGQLVPIVIQHAWNTQDYARFATPWETRWSTLCQDFHGTRGASVSVGGELLFEPVVEDTGNFDVMVVGHVGVVRGHNLLVPASLAQRAGDPVGARMRGIAVFVAEEPDTLRPPEGWAVIGASDTTYQVQTALDGRVVLIRGWTDRGPESANWVIDAAVEIALTAGTIKLAKYGMRAGRSLFNIAGKPVGKAPLVLAGATKELAKEEVAAQTAAATARQERVVHVLAKEEATSAKTSASATRSQNAAKGARPAAPAAREERHALERANTNLDNHPIAFERTQMPDEVVRGFFGDNTFKEMVRSGRYDAAMKAKLAGFYGEYRATLAARFGTPTGFQVPINEWREIVERLAAKWAVPI